MARQYQLKTFLRYTDKDLLAKYFQHKNIAFTLPAKQPEETELHGVTDNKKDANASFFCIVN